MSSGRSKAMTPALSVTNRTLWVVRSSARGTGQPLLLSTISMRHGASTPTTAVAASNAVPADASDNTSKRSSDFIACMAGLVFTDDLPRIRTVHQLQTDNRRID